MAQREKAALPPSAWRSGAAAFPPGETARLVSTAVTHFTPSCLSSPLSSPNLDHIKLVSLQSITPPSQVRLRDMRLRPNGEAVPLLLPLKGPGGKPQGSLQVCVCGGGGGEAVPLGQRASID